MTMKQEAMLLSHLQEEAAAISRAEGRARYHLRKLGLRLRFQSDHGYLAVDPTNYAARHVAQSADEMTAWAEARRQGLLAEVPA